MKIKNENTKLKIKNTKLKMKKPTNKTTKQGEIKGWLHF